jgi:OFA family oxalate/formate antiporter-like MFS transporter
MGIGLGFGYLSPVKTLMLWFKEQKGLATGLAVAGFGLAKMIASPIMSALISFFDERFGENQGIIYMFFALAALYFVMMFVGHLLLKKPDGWVEEPHAKSEGKITDVFKNKTFIGIWLMFFLNITCGLAIISQEKPIYQAAGIGAGTIVILCSVTALFNAFGRIGFSAAADKLKDRNSIYKLIFVLCIILSVITFATNGIANKVVVLVVILLCVVNAGYGGGFSNLPTLLSDRFGMKTISAVHGLALSAWAFAGIAGNQLSSLILKLSGDSANKYNYVLYVTAALYTIALIVSFVLVKPGKTE